MPTYDYQCDACGYTFETMQSMKDDPLRDCPSCQQPKLRRLISGGAGIIFKGSGFYVNDSKSGGRSKSKGSPAGETKKETGGDTKATDSAAPSSAESGGSSQNGGSGDASKTSSGGSDTKKASGSSAKTA